MYNLCKNRDEENKSRNLTWIRLKLSMCGTEEFKIYTAEPWIPEPSEIEVEMSVKKLKKFRSPEIDNIPAELIKAGGTALIKELHKLIGVIWRKEELPEE